MPISYPGIAGENMTVGWRGRLLALNSSGQLVRVAANDSRSTVGALDAPGATGQPISYIPIGADPIRLQCGETITAGDLVHVHATARGKVGRDTTVASKNYIGIALEPGVNNGRIRVQPMPHRGS